jgi:hypothetical protein
MYKYCIPNKHTFQETDVPSYWPDVSLSVAFAPSESFLKSVFVWNAGAIDQ